MLIYRLPLLVTPFQQSLSPIPIEAKENLEFLRQALYILPIGLTVVELILVFFSFLNRVNLHPKEGTIKSVK